MVTLSRDVIYDNKKKERLKIIAKHKEANKPRIMENKLKKKVNDDNWEEQRET